MHMLGEPKTMQDDPRYDDVVAEVARVPARARSRRRVCAGVAARAHLRRPGHRVRQDARAQPRAAPRHRARSRDSASPVLVGASRKRFIGMLTGVDDPAERLEGTAGAVAVVRRRTASTSSACTTCRR